ncbi:hypothetical protein E4U13_001001 [Claviceps humidiphila]|uniref:MARVEL domain-containing protein n=1 Tax=Claviceps humidiphila TaxID=1294629 RepID=A0A9P7Q3A5_9HYPO|nr:hypothetical protein E4U13_001001 [Claviceps humidiphila]
MENYPLQQQQQQQQQQQHHEMYQQRHQSQHHNQHQYQHQNQHQYQHQHQHQQHASPTQQALSSPTASSSMRWSRLSLRLISIAMNIALIALSAFYYYQWTLGPLIMMGPPAIVALLWSCIDIVCFCFRRGHAGVDPMACLIVDTLLFLGLTAISGALIAVLAHSHDYGYYFAFFDSGVGEEYLRIIVGFGIMATLTHLAILVLAWYERKMHGKVQSPPQVVYVHGQPYFAASPAQDPEAPPAYGAPTRRSREVHAEDSIQEMPATSDGMEQKKS